MEKIRIRIRASRWKKSGSGILNTGYRYVTQTEQEAQRVPGIRIKLNMILDV
jgi:hypothetical protein